MKFLPFIILTFILSCSTPAPTQTEADTNTNIDSHTHTDEESGFAFIENVKGKNGNIVFLKEAAYQKTFQYKEAKKVFDKLVEARGDFRMRVPTFVMSNAERRVAIAKPRKAEITLEMKAYEVCRSLGKDSLNAIAALLGHELVHYYEKHNWTNHFARQHKDMKTGAKLRSLDEALRLETQADYLGGFLGYSAGYNTLDVMPKILQAVYDQYGLTENISGYPSLSERKNISTKSSDKLKELVHVFETANYLTALGSYAEAKLYYEYILKDFQSRELYNNLGVLATQAAMKHMNANDVYFGFPLEMDAESRLDGGTRGGFGWSTTAETLLKQALSYFEQANQMDKEYPISMLNLACVNVLLSHDEIDLYDDAEFYARKAKKLCVDKKWTKTKNDIVILQGIIAARQKDNEAAARYFKKAATAGSSLAALNLKLLNDEPLGGEAIASRGFGGKDKFDDFNINKAVNGLLQGNLNSDKAISVDKSTFCRFMDKPESLVYINEKDSGEDHYYVFQIAKPNATKPTSKGINIGSSYEEIAQAYGTPSKSLELNNGRILVYFNDKMLFHLDRKGKVSKVGIFRYEEPTGE